jgi:hypothetical protein
MRSAAACEHRTGEDTAKRTLVRTRRRATVAKQDDELRGLAAMAGFRTRAKTPRGERPSCERSSHHSRQLDVQKGRQSLLVGVSRKASAESPKGRDPQGARCAARDASGARHSGFRATPGNAPRVFVLGVAVFFHQVADDRADSDPVEARTKKKRSQTKGLHAPGHTRLSLSGSCVDQRLTPVRRRRTSTLRRALADLHRKTLQMVVCRADNRLQFGPYFGAGVHPT